VLRGVAAEIARADEPTDGPPTLLARLRAVGAHVLAEEGANRPVDGVGYDTISDAGLTDLLLEPGVEALWC
jgi:hypothetical protein